MTDSESWTLREYLGGLVGGSVLLGIGIWMLVDPDKLARGEYGPGRGGSLMRLLDAVWGIPGAIALSVLGALIVAGTAMTLVSQGKHR
ncbi:MAG: hypothetical protein ACF8R9_12015 [Phycisphaerales bacterium JB054]